MLARASSLRAIFLLAVALAPAPVVGLAETRGRPAAVLRPLPIALSPGYCPSAGGDRMFESIQDVTWEVRGTQISFIVEIFIANPTGCTVGNPCPEYDDSPEFVNAWVDWNGDEIWDPAERVLDLAVTGYAGINYSGTMTGYGQAQIPEQHVTQPRMRVNLGWSFDPNDPCEPSWSWGDVRDFTIDLHIYNPNLIAVVTGNEVRELADRVVWEETFDADCKVTPVRVGYDALPVSGPLSTNIKLRADVERCRAGGGAPTIQCDWTIPAANASGGLTGTVQANAWSLEIPIGMPGRVGIYEIRLDFTITSPAPERAVSRKMVRRKLFVTVDTPVASAPINSKPKIKWYEKACDWASVASFDLSAVNFVRDGLYAYGGAHWKYGYFPGRCPWENLVEDSPCNYSDCYIFSQVLENVCGVLGVAGFTANRQDGARHKGFVTTGSPSLDPAFRGNAKPAAGGGYDRYWFSSHSLRERGGKYHDATFNGVYATETQFIAWNTGDFIGGVAATDEGAVVQRLAGDAYDSWSDYRYTPPPAPGLAAAPAVSEAWTPVAWNAVVAGAVRSPGLTFTGVFRDSLVDDDGNGLAEALRVDAEFNVAVPGEYLIYGVLRKDGQALSIRPRFESQQFSRFAFEGPAGAYTAHIEFSGEDIFSSGIDGPYRVHLEAVGTTAFEDSISHDTAALSHAAFGELLASLSGASDTGVDLDGDTRFDLLRVTVQIAVRAAGTYSLSAGLFAGSASIASRAVNLALPQGLHNVTLDLPGRAIRRKGLAGPYQVKLHLKDGEGTSLGSLSHTTSAYAAGDFEALLIQPTGVHSDLGVDLNDNGLFDELRASIRVLPETTGTFLVTAWLADPDSAGVPGSTFGVSPPATHLFSAGLLRDVTFSFRGPDIRAHGRSGPYLLSVAEVRDSGFQPLEVVPIGLPTAAYAPTDFEPGPPTLSFSGFSEDTEDTDSNLLADYLRASLSVVSTQNAVVLATADLFDDDGRFVCNGTAPPTPATAGVPAVLYVRFDGRYVWGNLRNGPFHVRNAYLYHSGNVGAGITVAEVGQTAPYVHTVFEPAAVITGTVESGPGVPAVGAELRAPQAVDFVDSAGRYRLIFLADQTTPVRARHASGPDWNVTLNGVDQGSGDSAIVEIVVGEVDTLNFRKSAVGVLPLLERSGTTRLARVVPNPFASSTWITFVVAREARVSLRVYDVHGRLVRTLLDRETVSGTRTVEWNGKDQAGGETSRGIYFCALATPDGIRTRRMTRMW